MGKKLLLIGAGGHVAVVTELIYELKDNAINSVYDCM